MLRASRATCVQTHKVSPSLVAIPRRACTSARPACVHTASQHAPTHLSKEKARRLTCAAATRNPVVCFFGSSDPSYTVIKVQVGMFGDIQKFQRELERLSELYDTDDPDSLYSILEATVLLMMRNIEYCGYGATAGAIFNDLDACEVKYNQVSMAERSKFSEETLVNMDGRRRTSMSRSSGSGVTSLDDWLCVTLLVAIEGSMKMGQLSSGQDLKRALTLLGGVSPDNLIAFELLWTPQATGDSYSRDELLLDYPSMSTLS